MKARTVAGSPQTNPCWIRIHMCGRSFSTRGQQNLTVAQAYSYVCRHAHPTPCSRGMPSMVVRAVIRKLDLRKLPRKIKWKCSV